LHWNIVGDALAVPQIVLYFTGLQVKATPILLPIHEIVSDVTITLSDRAQPIILHPTDTLNTIFPLTTNLTVTITDGFCQFGNGDGSVTSGQQNALRWVGSSFLSSVVSWSNGIIKFPAAFWNCLSLKTVPNMLPKNVIDTSYMFYVDPELASTNTLTFTGLDSSGNSLINTWNTSFVHYMQGMFANNNTLDGALNFSLWDTQHVLNMSQMFQNCSKITGRGIDNWFTLHVTDMSSMLEGCIQLSANLDFTPRMARWNTKNVENMQQMFCMYPYDSLPPLFIHSPYPNVAFKGVGVSLWNTENVKSMSKMFQLCNSFNQDLGSWNISSVAASQDSMKNMLDLTNMSADNYLSTLKGWVSSCLTNNAPLFVELGAAGIRVPLSWNATTAHHYLIQNYFWTIDESNHLYNYTTKGFAISYNNEYQCTVAAINSVGIGASSIRSPVFFLENSVCSPPTKVYVSSSQAGNTQITLSWTQPADYYGSVLKHYLIQVIPVSTTNNSVLPPSYIITTTDTKNSYSITLLYGIVYQFQVAAVVDVGTSNFSELSSKFQLTQGICSAPTNVTAVLNIDTSVVVVTWTPPSNLNGTRILYYNVQAVSNNITNIYRTNGTETIINILVQINTDYVFYVTAVTDNGNSIVSSPSNIINNIQTQYVKKKVYATNPNTSTTIKYTKYVNTNKRAKPPG
jgi:hypothetical protein